MGGAGAGAAAGDAGFALSCPPEAVVGAGSTDGLTLVRMGGFWMGLYATLATDAAVTAGSAVLGAGVSAIGVVIGAATTSVVAGTSVFTARYPPVAPTTRPPRLNRP